MKMCEDLKNHVRRDRAVAVMKLPGPILRSGEEVVVSGPRSADGDGGCKWCFLGRECEYMLRERQRNGGASRCRFCGRAESPALPPGALRAVVCYGQARKPSPLEGGVSYIKAKTKMPPFWRLGARGWTLERVGGMARSTVPPGLCNFRFRIPALRFAACRANYNRASGADVLEAGG